MSLTVSPPVGRRWKCADIPDELVFELAHRGHAVGTRGAGALGILTGMVASMTNSNPGVLDALLDMGVPYRVALTKLERLADVRGLLDYGTSVAYAWVAEDAWVDWNVRRGVFTTEQASIARRLIGGWSGSLLDLTQTVREVAA